MDSLSIPFNGRCFSRQLPNLCLNVSPSNLPVHEPKPQPHIPLSRSTSPPWSTSSSPTHASPPRCSTSSEGATSTGGPAMRSSGSTYVSLCLCFVYVKGERRVGSVGTCVGTQWHVKRWPHPPPLPPSTHDRISTNLLTTRTYMNPHMKVPRGVSGAGAGQAQLPLPRGGRVLHRRHAAGKGGHAPLPFLSPVSASVYECIASACRVTLSAHQLTHEHHYHY